MLQKNVYIIYPAGYGGNFLNWAINISDKESSRCTVKNPVHTHSNGHLGGQGTSHLHKRVPTHTTVDMQIRFQVLHKITDKRVYICNDTWKNIHKVLECDPTAIFVSITDKDDDLQKSFGAIQCGTKWPVYMAVYCAKVFNGFSGIHKNFNPYDCANDILFRNFVVKNYLFPSNSAIEYSVIDKELDLYERWYNARNAVNPHEVNERYYLSRLNYDGRIFELDLKTLFSDSFVEWFEDFMEKSEVSDNYDTNQFRKIAPFYLEYQQNLQWYDSMLAWEKTGQVDDYLRSHSVIEAMFIKHLFMKTGQSKYFNFDLEKWQYGYNLVKQQPWPDTPNSIYELFSLPGGIQTDMYEISKNLNIDWMPLADNARSEVIDYWPCYQLDWENSSIDVINEVYQTAKNNLSY